MLPKIISAGGIEPSTRGFQARTFINKDDRNETLLGRVSVESRGPASRALVPVEDGTSDPALKLSQRKVFNSDRLFLKISVHLTKTFDWLKLQRSSQQFWKLEHPDSRSVYYVAATIVQ